MSNPDELSTILNQLGTNETGMDYESMMLDFIDAETERLSEANRRFFEPGNWAIRADHVRQELRKSLGLDPLPNRTPLNSHVIGSLTRDGYVIEKLVYEPRPGFVVPAHLYLPSSLKRGQKIPAVLYSCGHWMERGKMEPDIQACGIGFAKLGIATLVYDPIGQGERGCSFEAHGHRDFLLMGLSQAGLMAWESMRAIDYLLTRPEIDGSRIGMTGASGGGLNTLYTCAVDERISVSVPVCYVTSFTRFFRAMRGQNWNGGVDMCNQVPNLIEYGGMEASVSAMFPRPVMCITASFDLQFPVEGAREVVEKAKRAYGLLGESRVRLVEVNSDHGYNRIMREAAYGWFSYWFFVSLKSDPITEPNMTLEDPLDTDSRCLPEPRTPEQENLTLSGLARSGYAELEALREDQLDVEDRDACLSRMRSELEAMFGAEPRVGEAYVVSQRRVSDGGRYEAERYDLKTEPGICIPVVKIDTAAAEGPSYTEDPGDATIGIYLNDEGKTSGLQSILDESSRTVYCLDVRGTGETVVPAPEIQYLATVDGTLEKVPSKPGDTLEVEVATNSLVLGRSLLRQQVYDLRVVMKWIAARSGKECSFELISEGPRSCLISLIVSCLEGCVDRLALTRSIVPLDSVIGSRVSALPVGCYHFGLLRSFDVAQLVALSGAKNMTLSGCIDGFGKEVPIDSVLSELDWARQFLGNRRFEERVRIEA